MSSEMKLLLLTIMLIAVGIVAFWYSLRNCHQVEYQDLSGSHFVNVCEEGN